MWWSREVPPCHIAAIGLRHPLREPYVPLSEYTALLLLCLLYTSNFRRARSGRKPWLQSGGKHSILYMYIEIKIYMLHKER